MASYEAFAEVYDQLTDDVPYETMASYYQTLIERFGAVKENILLDLACGTGSLSERFAKMGYQVIGVDASEDMLSIAQEKKMESGLDILYLCQRMEDLDLYGTIDVCICALDSLNHLTSMAQVQQAMDKVSLFMNPGGVFLFDVNTVYKHEKVLGNETFVYDYDTTYLVWQNTLRGRAVDIHLDIFEADGDAYYRSEEAFTEYAYTHEEICGALEKAGFSLAAYYGENTFELPKEDTQRVVYAAVKR